MATELIGTEKQVTWAETIRAQFSTSFDLLAAKVSPETGEAIAPLRTLALRQSKAAWWIENRNKIVGTGVVGNAVLGMVGVCQVSTNDTLNEMGKVAMKAIRRDAVAKVW